MSLKLKDIATVSSGVTFRSRIEVSRNGGVRVIQMKDLGDDNLVHLNNCICTTLMRPKLSQVVELGDIIFRSRGQTNTAALLDADTKDTIVAAPLFRVRPDANKVLPEFLLWWINQPSSQSYLASRSKGTMVKMISKQGLEDLEVILPSLEQQSKIASFFKLSIREQCLLEELKGRKSVYTQEVLMRAVSESRLIESNDNASLRTVVPISDKTKSAIRN